MLGSGCPHSDFSCLQLYSLLAALALPIAGTSLWTTAVDRTRGSSQNHTHGQLCTGCAGLPSTRFSFLTHYDIFQKSPSSKGGATCFPVAQTSRSHQAKAGHRVSDHRSLGLCKQSFTYSSSWQRQLVAPARAAVTCAWTKQRRHGESLSGVCSCTDAMWLAEEFNINCWDNPVQGKHELYEWRRKGKGKGTAWDGGQKQCLR